MQLAAIAALQNSKEWHRKMNIELYSNRRNLAEEIMKTLGCTFDEKQVGMFLWGKIPDNYVDSGELADKVLYNAKVFITPGFIFGEKGKRFIRISLCASEKMLNEALERVKKKLLMSSWRMFQCRLDSQSFEPNPQKEVPIVTGKQIGRAHV